jgi:hypothetical protein
MLCSAASPVGAPLHTTLGATGSSFIAFASFSMLAMALPPPPWVRNATYGFSLTFFPPQSARHRSSKNCFRPPAMYEK